MRIIWRRAILLFLAAALIGAGAVAASAESAASGGIHITIGARSPHYPGAVRATVDGYALTVYQDTSGRLDTAVVTGRITGAKSGDVAQLFASPFGTTKFTATGARLTLRKADKAYRFNVVPSIGTRYEVRIANVTSARATVYVTEVGLISHTTKNCSTTSCTFSYQVREHVPARTYAKETSKHWYLYQAVGHPALPAVFQLSTKATASKVRKVGAGEFEVTLSWQIKVSATRKTSWQTTFCTRDSEKYDGMGLPGHHGCGDKTIALSASYVG